MGLLVGGLVRFLVHLGVEIILIVHLLEDWQSLQGSCASVSVDQVHEYTVRSLLDSLEGEACFLRESSPVANLVFLAEIVDTMQELAPLSVKAAAFIMELCANFSLVVGWKMRLWHQLFLSVSIGASGSILTVLVEHDVSAHLGLLHLLNLLVELNSILSAAEVLLLSCPGGFTVIVLKLTDGQNFEVLIILVVMTSARVDG